MKDNRINAIIAVTALVASVIMVLALSFAIGKWSLGGSHYDLVINFPNATGINPNSGVKFAGADIGRVKSVTLIPRKDQTQDPDTKLYNCIRVVAEINSQYEVDEGVSATIKQDGIGLSAKYVLLTPGPDHDSKALADGAVLQGTLPYDLTNLIQPAGEALQKAKSMLTTLQPVMDRFDRLSSKLDTDLPPLINHADKFLQDGDGVMANLNSPGSRDNITTMLNSLRVSTENLKVVSSNAKAFTATLADKPWRVFWGGNSVKPPSEADVLKSNVVIPLNADVDVNGTTDTPNVPVKKKATTTSAKPTQLN